MTTLVSPPAPAADVEAADISAAWRYRSGAGHFALDFAMPERRPLFAVRNGVVLDCRDGVVDHTPGRPGNETWQSGPGSPSNWILLRVKYRGRWATVYYQHLSDTQVKKGDRVYAGQRIGLSGQTGNATGPHLHIAAMWGGNYTASTRYAYMLGNGQNPPPPGKSVCIWTPQRLWSTADYVSLANLGRGKQNKDVLQVQQAMAAVVGLDYSSAPGRWGPLTDAAWEKVGDRCGKDGLARLAWLGAAAPRDLGITATP